MRRQQRKPTYPAAMRLARIVLELASRPYGWSFDAIKKELRISDRTLKRYVAASRSELLDWAGRPNIEVLRRGPGRWLRLRSSSSSRESNPYRAASLYFMLTFLKFLEGTVLRETAEDLWERTLRGLAFAEQERLAHFDRKFYAVPFAPKIYREYDDQLDIILRAVIDQNTIRVDYGGLSGEGREHEFEPYTLVAYRGGLYVLGLSRLYRRVIYLAVERIRKAEFVIEAMGNRIRFAYPKSYRPERHLDGTFGLIEGPETEVELLLLADTYAYLRSRLIHPTQTFRRRRDGKMIMNMRVRGTMELRNFILGLGPWVEVLKPASLRRELAGLTREAADLY